MPENKNEPVKQPLTEADIEQATALHARSKFRDKVDSAIAGEGLAPKVVGALASIPAAIPQMRSKPVQKIMIG